MDKPEHIWFLMARNLGGEATAEEQQELMQVLQQHPQWMQQYDMMKTLWKPASARLENAGDEGKIRQILQLAAAETEKTPVVTMPVRGNRRRKWYVAASLIAVVGIAAWAISLSLGYNLTSHNAQQEIVAQKGSKTRTLLPDGSTVWLNAGSKISYSSDFSGPVRHVTLQGEAFFDVVKQPDRPFIVHAADIDIKVLGTAFNVKSYDEDRTVETTLIRGLVSITRTNANSTAQQPILLHPNQKIVLQKTPLPAEESSSPDDAQAGPGKNFAERVTQIDSNRRENELLETAWVYNRLEFRGDRFPDLARKLERWYNINIHFEDDAVRGLSFNGSLESETVDQAFAALKAAVPFRYTIKGTDIYVRSME